jgi:hypothetical protein
VDEGKLIGPNLMSRLLRALNWAEQQMGEEPPAQPPTPLVLEASLPLRWGILDAALPSGSAATVSIWKGHPLADSGTDVTAYAPPLLSGTIALGASVLIARIYGKWYVIATECPPA